MDPDAPPLVKADSLASQGEQLSSRRAYQQALAAHLEAAKQYQLAAHATNDTSAGKALLLQRDKQFKLAEELRRKLDRLKTTGVSSNSNSKGKAPAASTSGPPIPNGLAGPSQYAASRINAAGQSSAQLVSPGVASRSSRPPASSTSTSTSPMSAMMQQGTNPHHFHYQYQTSGTASTSTSTMFSGARRADASIMADSRYSRKSNSPSQSQISQTIPHSGDSARAGSSVEESYYLMQNENDPTDPFSAFLHNVENMVQELELGNAVAFATAPLYIDTSRPLQSTATDKPDALHKPADVTAGSSEQSKPGGSGTSLQGQVSESFYVVPSIGRPNSVPTPTGTVATQVPPTSEELARNKTHEELVAENVTLKETLDGLSKKYDWLLKERQRERESLKESVTHFARDVRRQAERLGQSTANLADTRRQMPIPPFSALGHTNTSTEAELHRRIATLQEELRVSKTETEKQTSLAQRYRTRYDDLRKAILEKRKAKETATAAAAASSPGDSLPNQSSSTQTSPS